MNVRLQISTVLRIKDSLISTCLTRNVISIGSGDRVLKYLTSSSFAFLISSLVCPPCSNCLSSLFFGIVFTTSCARGSRPFPVHIPLRDRYRSRLSRLSVPSKKKSSTHHASTQKPGESLCPIQFGNSDAFQPMTSFF